MTPKLNQTLVRCCGWIAAVGALTLGSTVIASSTAALTLGGAIYTPAGSQPGEQTGAVVGISKRGGLIVWQDNSVGGGLSIRGRILSPDFSAASSPFYFSAADSAVNGDQENPQVAVAGDGTSAVVWQAGVRGHQNVKLRLIAGGAFVGAEIPVAGGTNANETIPALAFLSDGSLIVAWTSEDLSQVPKPPTVIKAQKFSSTGQKLGSIFQVSTTDFVPQRSVSVVALPTGGFGVSWISEQERGLATSDVIVKVYDSSNGVVGSQRANASNMTCDAPKLALLDGGSILAIWTQIDPLTTQNWNIAGRLFSYQSESQGSAFQVNTGAIGHQLDPQVASGGAEAFVVWRSLGDTSLVPAIMGATVGSDGVAINSEIQLSGGMKGNKFFPGISALGTGQYLATWSAFNTLDTGDDIYAQRVQRTAQPLPAPAAPFSYPLAPTRLVVSWPAVQGYSVDHYDVFIDGSLTPVSTNGLSITTAAFAPSSTHTATLRYVLGDGRTSPISAISSTTTWGEDANADGIPDDWEYRYFGSDPSRWPSPDADSDGDGVSNRQEFLAGTDPTSAASVLRVKIAVVSGETRLVWNSLPGRTYQVLMSSDLNTWAAFGGPVLSVSDTAGLPLNFDASGTYFRVSFIR